MRISIVLQVLSASIATIPSWANTFGTGVVTFRSTKAATKAAKNTIIWLTMGIKCPLQERNKN